MFKLEYLTNENLTLKFKAGVPLTPQKDILSAKIINITTQHCKRKSVSTWVILFDLMRKKITLPAWWYNYSDCNLELTVRVPNFWVLVFNVGYYSRGDLQEPSEEALLVELNQHSHLVLAGNDAPSTSTSSWEDLPAKYDHIINPKKYTRMDCMLLTPFVILFWLSCLSTFLGINVW